MEQVEAQEGHYNSSNHMLHDLEAEYLVKNISKENAQALLMKCLNNTISLISIMMLQKEN